MAAKTRRLICPFRVETILGKEMFCDCDKDGCIFFEVIRAKFLDSKIESIRYVCEHPKMKEAGRTTLKTESVETGYELEVDDARGIKQG